MSNKWDLGFGYLKTPFVLKEGCLEIPRGPGLGIEVNEDAVRERTDDGAEDAARAALADECVADHP